MLKHGPLGGGYSFVELLVIIAVIALLLATAIPAMSEMLANMQLRGAAEAMMSGLQKARSEAVKSNQTVTFWLVSSASNSALDNSCQLSSTSPSWVVSLDDPSGACASAPSTTTAPRILQVNNVGNAASNMAVTAVNAAATATAQLSFNGLGRRPPATSATDISTIDLTSPVAGTRRLRLEISVAGATQLCDRDLPVTTPPDPKACNP